MSKLTDKIVTLLKTTETSSQRGIVTMDFQATYFALRDILANVRAYEAIFVAQSTHLAELGIRSHIAELEVRSRQAKQEAYVEFRDAAMGRQYDDLWDICADLLNKVETR